MKKILFTLYFLLASAMGFADGINMVGDPPESHTDDGHRGQVFLPTVDYADSEVTIFVPYQIDDMAVTIRDNQECWLSHVECLTVQLMSEPQRSMLMSAINKLAEMPNSAKEMQYLLNMNNHHARFKNFSI